MQTANKYRENTVKNNNFLIRNYQNIIDGYYYLNTLEHHVHMAILLKPITSPNIEAEKDSLSLPFHLPAQYRLYHPVPRHQRINVALYCADVSEDIIRSKMPDILDILLIDRTTSSATKPKNIIWANENYIEYGKRYYSAKAQIKPSRITGRMGHLIMPRALKSQMIQKERTKSKAEVFTPTWIVKKQNDIIDNAYVQDDLQTYIARKWLEITCGEAPYMITRYDMQTGKMLPLANRVGFVDRKLQRINAEVNDKAQWQRMAMNAYKSSYGFEWHGDSLLLARENLLYTYRDYYVAKWEEEPLYGLFEDIAEIISYNVFQMDGLKYIIPLSDKRTRLINKQLALFEDEEQTAESLTKPGRRVKIMNWQTKKMEFFDKELRQ